MGNRKYKTGFRSIILVFMVVQILGVVAYSSGTEADSYYIEFMNDEDNNVTMEIGKQIPIIEQAYGNINLDNLSVHPTKVRSHFSFSASDSEIDTLTREAREYLLYFGYATLIDENNAPSNELASQNHAKSNQLGIWSKQVNNGSQSSVPPDEVSGDASELPDVPSAFNVFWAFVKQYVVEHYQWIISTILGCGIISFVYKHIQKRIRTRKKTVFLGGANASGKTTLRSLLMNPEASIPELLIQSPTLKVAENRIIRDDENVKISLEANLLDTPGHDLYQVIDQLSCVNSSKNKFVVIIVLSPTKSYDKRNEADFIYIKDQYVTLEKLWTAVLKAKTIIKPETVVLFINKNDLFDDKSILEELFNKHKKLMSEVCKDARIDFEFINGSVIEKVGMTKLMQILKKKV